MFHRERQKQIQLHFLEMNRPPKRRPLPACFQKQILEKNLPTIYSSSNIRGMYWKGYIRPKPVCQKYLIQIDYTLGKRPDVTVISPQLIRRYDDRIPHMFEQKRLCLFDFKNNNWRPVMRFDKTIIPWTSMWLFYYELWHATGEWLGGGAHPSTAASKKKVTKYRNVRTGG